MYRVFQNIDPPPHSPLELIVLVDFKAIYPGVPPGYFHEFPWGTPGYFREFPRGGAFPKF
jgi:hypothetical protein